MSRQIRCSLILLTTAAIWGLAYVAQKKALGSLGPFALNTLRGILAWMFLIPCRSFLEWYDKKKGKVKKYDRKVTIIGGCITGSILFIACVLQAYGITQSDVGKAGFLTTLYIVIVPCLSIFIGKKCSAHVWGSVAIALVGTYFLCVKSNFTIAVGDIWLLLCAFFFACNIIVVGTVCDKVDGVRMSIVQFFVSSCLSLIPAVLIEHPSGKEILDALPFVAYSGIFSCGVGYTIEIIGQDGLNPTVASLILSFESVFSLLAGWLLLNERMSGREIIGCLIVIIAVVIAQLPDKKQKNSLSG